LAGERSEEEVSESGEESPSEYSDEEEKKGKQKQLKKSASGGKKPSSNKASNNTKVLEKTKKAAKAFDIDTLEDWSAKRCGILHFNIFPATFQLTPIFTLTAFFWFLLAF
jgi:hypothetical protein